MTRLAGRGTLSPGQWDFSGNALIWSRRPLPFGGATAPGMSTKGVRHRSQPIISWWSVSGGAAATHQHPLTVLAWGWGRLQCESLWLPTEFPYGLRTVFASGLVVAPLSLREGSWPDPVLHRPMWGTGLEALTPFLKKFLNFHLLCPILLF